MTEKTRLLLSTLALVLATSLGFAARTSGWTARDWAFSQAVQSARAPWLTGIAQVLDIGFSTVAGTIIVIALTAGLALAGRHADAVRTLAVVLAGWGISMVLKVVVGRPRPPVHHALLGELGDNSFPSGHVCLTLSLAIAAALLIRRRWVIVAGAVVVVAQMFARVYLGAHYFTDTLGSLVAAPAAIVLALSLGRARRLGVLLLGHANRRRARQPEPPGSRQIKILLLHANGMGGTIRSVYNLAADLATDHEVEIVSVVRTRPEPFFAVPDGVTVTFLDDRVGRRPWGLRSRLIPREEAAYKTFSLRTDWLLIRFLRGLHGGVLISTRPGLNLVTALFAPPGVITIAQEHVGLAAHKPAIRALIRRRYGRLSALVTLTEADRTAYRTILGADARLERIPNALTPLTGGPSPLEAPTVLAIGRLTRVKGFDLLIKAWQRVAADFPGWRLRIVGAGPQMAHLATAVRDRELEDSVQLPGPIADIGAQLDGASVLALSSRHEGFSMTIVEALSKGVPVVSFDCPNGPREIITQGREGLLVPAGDTAALAEAIEQLIRDRDRRLELGGRGLQTAKRYDPGRIGTEWRRLLDDLAAAG
ncbi:glycosyltransferase [Acrocarpospora catenulata]|uniref:glycosyltransferase n=1 Tax=Acrocarpospora catenulata TaxID=2836182 RepID=UPI001BD9837A|nr:glycosyltransferase [Acrocarpospora catenulata]